MKAFLTRPKRKSSPEQAGKRNHGNGEEEEEEEELTTDVKLAILASLHPQLDQDVLLDVLLACDGSVSEASAAVKSASPTKKRIAGTGYQQSLRSFTVSSNSSLAPAKKKLKSKKGSTLHLYDPEDVAEYTPCTIIHNFLPSQLANDLLRELLEESKSFEKITFKLFENVVSSPHTSSFFVESYDDVQKQKTDFHYNGARLTDVRPITPQLVKVKPLVEQAVNTEIAHRIKTRYPGGRKLRFQSPNRWKPNSAFVNCYNGPQESVGWHSDQLTYLGPRAVIGSISLGVAREFRVRRVLPKDGDDQSSEDVDAEGQISIHLPHNSLLVMHAEMQEEWKHCVTPAASIDPHPVSGVKRINITYRDYRANMHPRHTPKCTCGVPCVLRVVQRKKENFGKYFWMCHAGNIPDKEGCTFFQWAEFDDDGNPMTGASKMSSS
jgi:alkylated DNA repair dioxygenase AlkB